MSDRIPISRGIEVLVKKAAVDPDFRRLLLAARADAAREIGLDLSPGEAAMLQGVPAAQLEAIIAQTVVSPVSRASFLGRAAAAMLAALGATTGCEMRRAVGGIRPATPDATAAPPGARPEGGSEKTPAPEPTSEVSPAQGIRPDRP